MHKKSPRKATPSPSGNDRLDQISRQEKWPSTLNNSNWETLGIILTSLQQREWITSTPSPLSTNKEVPEFSCPVSSPPVQSLPFGLFTVQWESSLGGGEGGLTMALQSTTIHQYDWLVKASFHQACLQHTHSLGTQYQE